MARIELSDTELQNAMQAARIAAVQAETDASNQTSPTVRATFDRTRKAFEELAAKFERARQAK